MRFKVKLMQLTMTKLKVKLLGALYDLAGNQLILLWFQFGIKGSLWLEDENMSKSGSRRSIFFDIIDRQESIPFIQVERRKTTHDTTLLSCPEAFFAFFSISSFAKTLPINLRLTVAFNNDFFLAEGRRRWEWNWCSSLVLSCATRRGNKWDFQCRKFV